MKTLTLTQYLMQLWASQTKDIFLALLISGTVGMFANYLTKWAKNEIEGSLFCYLFHSSVRLTVLSFLTFVGVAITAIQTGIFFSNGTFIGFGTVLWFGFSNGFAVDAIVNKGRRQPWTDEQRDAKTNSPLKTEKVTP